MWGYVSSTGMKQESQLALACVNRAFVTTREETVGICDINRLAEMRRKCQHFVKRGEIHLVSLMIEPIADCSGFDLEILLTIAVKRLASRSRQPGDGKAAGELLPLLYE